MQENLLARMELLESLFLRLETFDRRRPLWPAHLLAFQAKEKYRAVGIDSNTALATHFRCPSSSWALGFLQKKQLHFIAGWCSPFK
jgi:hypothetical protein